MQRAAFLARAALSRPALRRTQPRTLVPPRVAAAAPSLRLLPPLRHASHAAPAAQRSDAPLDASLDRLLPESLFAAPAPAASSSAAGEAPRPLPRALARAVVARVLAQLRAASDAPTLEQARREESECNAMVRAGEFAFGGMKGTSMSCDPCRSARLRRHRESGMGSAVKQG
jgi:hypothetical protein